MSFSIQTPKQYSLNLFFFADASPFAVPSFQSVYTSQEKLLNADRASVTPRWILDSIVKIPDSSSVIKTHCLRHIDFSIRNKRVISAAAGSFCHS